MDDDHKANMHRVVVGAEGKKYAEAVNDFMGQVKKCEQTKKDSSLQYSASPFSRIYTIEKFIALSKNTHV